MNVVKLISEGITKQYGASVAPCCAAAFDFGVRHALAALFPVVQPEDINLPDFDETRIYAKRPDEEDWRLVELNWDTEELVMCLSSCWWGRDWTVFEAKEEGFEFRRCPTPGDVGMGGEA